MKRILALALLLLLIAPAAHALNTQSLRYYFPGGRALSLVESKPKPMDTLTLGFGFNYAMQPFEFGNSSGSSRVQGIVDNLFTFDFMGSYSFSDRFALGINLPVHISNNLLNINSTQFESPMNLGDIMLSGLYTIIDPSENQYNAGLGIVPFFSFPTGRSSDFVGDTNVTGGFLFAGDIDIGGHYIGLNLGVRFREQENFLNLTVSHEMIYDIAYHYEIFPEQQLAAFAELSGATVFEDFFSKTNESPFEARVGATKAFLLDEPLKVTLASGLGIVNGYANPDFRVALKIAYDHILPRTKKIEVVKIVERPIPVRIQKIEKELKELTIYYPTDGDQVDPFYDEKIAGIAKILKKNPDIGPLYIVGHTDSVGNRMYNQKLSERRAGKAADSIMGMGLDRKDIVWVGLGEEHPKVENTSDANRSLNRRSLFTFIKPKELKEKYTRKGVVGINLITGKKNDSYTEVLKMVDAKKEKQAGDDAVIIRKYKDKSEVIADDDESALTKDTPTSKPKSVKTKPSKKKYIKTKKMEGDKTVYEDEDIFEEFE